MGERQTEDLYVSSVVTISEIWRSRVRSAVATPFWVFFCLPPKLSYSNVFSYSPRDPREALPAALPAPGTAAPSTPTTPVHPLNTHPPWYVLLPVAPGRRAGPHLCRAARGGAAAPFSPSRACSGGALLSRVEARGVTRAAGVPAYRTTGSASAPSQRRPAGVASRAATLGSTAASSGRPLARGFSKSRSFSPRRRR